MSGILGAFSQGDLSAAKEALAATKRVLTLTRLSTIQPQPVYWLWDNRIPLGSFGLMAGREGFGKSMIAIWMAAQTTRGTLPGEYLGQPRKVIICATEDSFAHTIVPRLIAANANMDLVARIDVTQGQTDVELVLPTDIPALVEQVRSSQTALIILDPLTSRLHARLDTHKDADVRRALEPITKLAGDTGATVLGIIHLSKSTTHNDPNNMIMGSRAFSAVSRFTLMVCEDWDHPEPPPTFILGQPKNSLGPSFGLPVLPYQIASFSFSTTEDGKLIKTSLIQWLPEDASRAFADVMRKGSQKEQPARENAAAWLRKYLSTVDGMTALAKDIYKDAEAAGHNKKTLQRAADDVLKVTRSGQGPKATWTLPADQKLPF